MSAQNLLLALGAPLNFDREDYPFNKLYPFPLELRPISVQSLARYVLAEMPILPPCLPDWDSIWLKSVRTPARLRGSIGWARSSS